MSREKLNIAAGHPDRVGGLAFVGEAQTAFGVVIFGWGIVMVSDAITQMMITRVQSTLAVHLVAFVLLAPMAFLAPLFLFTSKIYHAKERGLLEYNLLLTRFIIGFEEKLLRTPGPANLPCSLLLNWQHLPTLRHYMNMSRACGLFPSIWFHWAD